MQNGSLGRIVGRVGKFISDVWNNLKEAIFEPVSFTECIM
jgi:hypothetical protein